MMLPACIGSCAIQCSVFGSSRSEGIVRLLEPEGVHWWAVHKWQCPFNLYIDPKEEYPVGHRMNAFLASMAQEMKGHAVTFKKYPAKDIGLGH